jgi:hypothetical protein
MYSPTPGFDVSVIPPDFSCAVPTLFAGRTRAA